MQIITFDGKRLFEGEGHVLEIGTWQRKLVERGFAGLDGVMSIDLGRRSRTIKQRGTLSASSRAALRIRKKHIEEYIDGFIYELKDQEGESYDGVRMDRFETGLSEVSGSRVQCSYEIMYTQLRE
ncbi:MAG: hypothetical protein JW860_08340 [Sedimentisphaerales bacterium]|nr:hypothetical protein [Sedimentisphaerales bacterium]